jgi:hypothetical protein
MNFEGLSVVQYGSFIDPNRVYRINGEFFRRLSPSGNTRELGRWSRTQEFILGKEMKSLVEHGLVLNYDVASPVQIGPETFIRAPEVPFPVPCQAWSNAQRRDALVLIAEINRTLEETGSQFRVTDGHLSNVLFVGPTPKYVDIGSFSHVNARDSLDYLVNESTRWFGDVPKSASETCGALIDYLCGLETYEMRSGWDDYASTDLPSTKEEIIPKTSEQSLLVSWAKRLNPGTITDIAGNNGILSRLLAVHCKCRVLCCDKSGVAIADCYRNAKQLDLPINCAVFDLLTPRAWFETMASELCIASSISHHLYDAGAPFSVQEHLWSRLARRWIAVEYIGPDDPHVSKWKLKMPESYTIDHFHDSFKSGWKLLETATPEMPSRIWHLYERTSFPGRFV